MPDELDVRPMRKPDRHPTVFRTYDTLAVGGSFVLVSNHDPVHLRDEFDLDHPGSHRWEYLQTGPEVWRVRITRLAATPLPRVVGDVRGDPAGDADPAGAVWKLRMRQRDLDSNVVALPPGGTIDVHAGPDLDVLVVVVAGTGQVSTELEPVDLHPGALVWLPRRSRRGFTAGPDGLRYLTVHQRRRSLVLDTSRARGPAG